MKHQTQCSLPKIRDSDTATKILAESNKKYASFSLLTASLLMIIGNASHS